MSALRKEGGLEDQGREVSAILSSDKIKSDDLRAGLYRQAQITEKVVNWMHPWGGHLTSSVYWITETEYDSDVLTAQVSGVGSKLRAQVGQNYALECQWDLGENFGEASTVAGCKIDKGLYTKYFALVEYPVTLDNRRQFHSKTSLSGHVGDEDGFFSLGRVIWVGGLNSGLSEDVRIHSTVDSDDWDIELMAEMPYDIQAYDQFHIEPGCNKLTGIGNAVGDCQNTFSNFDNFGGAPFLPGTDKMSQVPLR